MESCGKNITLSRLAELTGGEVYGDGSVAISGVCSIDNPVSGNIALALMPSKIHWESNERPSAIIVKKNAEGHDIPQLVHANPRLAFTHALRHFYIDEKIKSGIDPNAGVAEDAEIAPDARVGPFAVVESKAVIGPGAIIGAGCYIGERSVIGKGTKLYPNVSVMHDVTTGARCIFHSGVVIGSDGFGFTPTPDGNLKVPQVGRVEIGNDVEIGANSTIDRATLDVTRIGDDVKIDNLVQVAHNVQIGPHTRIAAQAGMSGRVVIESNVVIAGQAGFQNGVRVGEGSVIAGRAGVTRDVSPGSRISGFPARDHKQALRILAAQNRIPEIIERLEKVEEQLKESKTER